MNASPAPDFRLVDQDGSLVSLANFRGKVVVLTFMYTQCPDVCPLIAERFRATSQQLGAKVAQVAYVAISVDPENDTPAAIKSFALQHHLDGQLRYLSGTREQLQGVWKSYYVYAQIGASPSLLVHSTRVIVIDKTGKQRVNLSSDFDPTDLAYDLRELVNE